MYNQKHYKKPLAGRGVIANIMYANEGAGGRNVTRWTAAATRALPPNERVCIFNTSQWLPPQG